MGPLILQISTCACSDDRGFQGQGSLLQEIKGKLKPNITKPDDDDRASLEEGHHTVNSLLTTVQGQKNHTRSITLEFSPMNQKTIELLVSVQ